MEDKGIIALSLWNNDKNFTFGALRNVQLASLFYPTWKVRIFIPHPTQSLTNISIPNNIILKLNELGAEVVYVGVKGVQIPLNLVSTLVADDHSRSYFIIRDVRNRLSQRDANAVSEWIASNKAVHCIRDLPIHRNVDIVSGLWGANIQQLHILLDKRKMSHFNVKY